MGSSGAPGHGRQVAVRPWLALLAVLALAVGTIAVGMGHLPHGAGNASYGAATAAVDLETHTGHADAPAARMAPHPDDTCATCGGGDHGTVIACTLALLVVVLLALTRPRRLTWEIARARRNNAATTVVLSRAVAPDLRTLSISRT